MKRDLGKFWMSREAALAEDLGGQPPRCRERLVARLALSNPELRAFYSLLAHLEGVLKDNGWGLRTVNTIQLATR